MKKIDKFAVPRPVAEQFVPPELTARPQSAKYQAARRLRDSGRWQKLRRLVLEAEPLCRVKGCHNVAVEVHHIRPAAKRPDLFFVRENLAPLCKTCHENIPRWEAAGLLEILLPTPPDPHPDWEGKK